MFGMGGRDAAVHEIAEAALLGDEMPDDTSLARELILRAGKLVPKQNEPIKSGPSSEVAPRHRGFDMALALGPKAGDGTINTVMKGLGILGGAMPISVIEKLLDMYQPVRRGLDVELPNESGKVDPRLLR